MDKRRKLTLSQVLEIINLRCREERERRPTLKVVARQFDVSVQTIWNIQHRRTWKRQARLDGVAS